MWTRHWSKSKDAPYWHHSSSGQTSWTDPTGKSTSSKSMGEPKSESQGQSVSQSVSAGGWTERFSNSKQAPYWVNSATNESTWTRPAALGRAEGAGQQRDRPGQGQGQGEGGDQKRRRLQEAGEGGHSTTATATAAVEPMSVSDEQRAAFWDQLAEERRAAAPPAGTEDCPRERDSIDMAGLVRRLHSQQARREDRSAPPHHPNPQQQQQQQQPVDYRVIFSLAGKVQPYILHLTSSHVITTHLF